MFESQIFSKSAQAGFGRFKEPPSSVIFFFYQIWIFICDRFQI